MSLYAHYGLKYIWMVNPIARTLETYTLNEGAWTATGAFRADAVGVRAEPFAAYAIA